MKHLFIATLLCAVVFTSCQKEPLQPGTTTNTGNVAANLATADGVSYNAATGVYTLTLQPGPRDGNDLWMKNWVARPSYADTSDSKIALIKGLAYNLYGSLVRTRSVIKFDNLANIPATATITGATLYLYGPLPGSKDVSVHLPMGNTSYPGADKGNNTCLLQRITSNWNINTISWNNPPATTTTNQVVVGPSTQQWQWDVALNVTSLVRPMVKNPGNNNGFLLKLQTERQPRALGFLSADSPEANRRPKLVVTYKLQ